MSPSPQTPWYLPDTPMGRGAAAGAAVGFIIGLGLLLHAAPPGQAAQWMGDPAARAVVRRAAILVLALTALGAAVTAALFLVVEQVRGRLGPRRPAAPTKPAPRGAAPSRARDGGPAARRQALRSAPPPSSPPPPAPPAIEERAAESFTLPAVEPAPLPAIEPALQPAAAPAPPIPFVSRPSSRSPGRSSLRSLIRTTEEVLAEVAQQGTAPPARNGHTNAGGADGTALDGPHAPAGTGSPNHFPRLAFASTEIERIADAIAAEQADNGIRSDRSG